VSPTRPELRADRADIIIVGTGVSALLLAKSLLERRVCWRLRIIGPKRPLNAHLLSMWSDAPAPFDPFTIAAWSSIAIGSQSGEQQIPLSRTTYRSFRAQAWADALRREIVAHPEVQWIESTASRHRDHPLHPSVEVGADRLKADWVFTSAPRVGGPAPQFWQRFVGWEIVVHDKELDVRAATLLDFRTASRGDFRFVYALPLSPHRLFVEHVSYEPCDHDEALERYLRDIVGVTRYERVDREHGATPIYAEPLERSLGRLVPIGVSAGLAKISTGYAVMRLWRDSERIARALQERGDLSTQLKVPSLHDVADRFFLDLLRGDRARIPELLSALFSRVRGDAVLAFLDDRARWTEQLQIALAMPGWLPWALSSGGPNQIGL
jgi:lycopene beta-cyclase